MPGKTIATIYFYIVSAASLALIVIGIFNGVNFFINSTQFDKYPLRYYGPAVDCETSFGPYPAKVAPAPFGVTGDMNMLATPSAEELRKQKENCEKQQEYDRKQHRVDDIRNTLTFTLVGIVLFLIHFPQARKHSERE
jgi:hypothetical protein